MKISELTQISAIRRDIMLPLSIAGQNMSITLGQIMDAISQSVVPFNRVANTTDNITYSMGTDSLSVGSVVFDVNTNKFYLAIGRSSIVSGVSVRNWLYYDDWNTHDSYYGEDGDVRSDCLFITEEGLLYQFNGTTLIRAGLTEAEAKQIQLATAIEVADEEEMERRIAAGEYEDGQLYFTAEEE